MRHDYYIWLRTSSDKPWRALELTDYIHSKREALLMARRFKRQGFEVRIVLFAIYTKTIKI